MYIDLAVNKHTRGYMANRQQISAAVLKRLEELGKTADEVLRSALNLKIEGLQTEGVYFPEGTDFLAWYKDRPHHGKVKEGAIEVDGKRYPSVSAAAASITGRATTNGWDFWMMKTPNKTEFIPIKTLRKN